MLLEGSCHCGSVRFRVESDTFYPYQACYCSVCRKTAGGGGYAINLGAPAGTLSVEGAEHVTVYRARIDGETSPAERRFCARCGSALWVWDPRWPELVHPFARAVDTPPARARPRGGTAPGGRGFVARCGSALWVWDPRWPELVHPFASAIDTPLPDAPEAEHPLRGPKARRVRADASARAA